MKGVLHNGMSLFQDLKLKRRKVDSRCSSDGESIGTSDSAASLSPDAQNQNGEGSPKNKERCTTPEELVRSSSTTTTSASSPIKQLGKSGGNGYATQGFMFMMKGERKDHHPLSSSSKLNFISNLHQTTSSPVVTNKTPTTPTNGVIKMTNELNRNCDSPNKSSSVVVTPNNNESTTNGIVENGFSTKKSRARSLEKISEEDAEMMKNHCKVPSQNSSSSTSTSPLSSNGGSLTPPTMSPPPPPATPSSPSHIKSEKEVNETNKMEVDDETEHKGDKKVEQKTIIENEVVKVKTEPTPPIEIGEKRKFSSLSPPPNIMNLGGSNTNNRPREIINRSPGRMSNHSSRSSSPPSFILEKYSRMGGIGENNSTSNNSRSSPPNSVKSNNSRVPSPQELYRQSSPINHHQLSPQQQHMLLSQQSHLHARLLNGPNPPNQQQYHHLQHPESRIMVSSPMVQAELRNLTEKSDPVSVVTPTSLSFHHHSLYRINGVRPEVISGGAVTPASATSNGNTPNNQNNKNNNVQHRVNGSMSSNHSINSNSSSTIRKSPSIVSNNNNRSPNSSPRSNASSGSSGGSNFTNNTHLSNGSSIHQSPPNQQQQQQQRNLMSTVAGNIAMINSMSGQNSSNSNFNGGANNGQQHNHVNLNRTPTVIMGEAGGVRTMLWSQPGVSVSPDLGPSPHSQQQSGSPSTMNGNHYGLSSPNTHSHLTNGHSTSPPHHLNNNQSASISSHLKGGLSMERLWASEALNLSTGAGSNTNGFGSNNSTPNGANNFARNNHHGSANNNNVNIPTLGAGHGISNGHIHNSNSSGINTSLHPDDEEYEQPMICMICEDRATGLHYGIITCEGCKGFFKRTVQNRRVYTCVADGTCEITKAQRNRCQYCRFKKCIEQGMVLQAVREDRMPGGRNSGAVYNLYKVPVKYRKHKKGNRGGGGKLDKNNSGNLNNIIGSSNNSNSSNGLVPSPGPSPSPLSMTGTILKAALTSPNEINHMRPTTAAPFDQAAAMISNLVQCDNFHDIAALQNWEELLEGKGDLSEKLCQMGDSIVYRLVQWTKRLPFYQEVPVDVHTRILTHKWHELLVLTTSAWQAMNTPGPSSNLTIEEEAMENLFILQRCLQAMMGRSLTLEQLRQDVGQMVERLTYLTRSFRRLGIRLEEYVTLKVIAMLQNTGAKSNEVNAIQERYIKCLGTFLETTCPSHTNRLADLLRTLPEVQAAASLLLESKMFYVPFLLNSALQR